MSGSNIAFVLTGSIAAYKACEAVSQLVQRGHRVRAVATESALRFVGAATLEGLTGRPVLSDLFTPGAALEHIELGRWADVVIVCPATAHTLNRCAAGLADDFVGALFLAFDRTKPFLVAPAMNPAMWRHPATVSSVERLRGWGVRFVSVGEGRTACGDVGEGRLAEPTEIVAGIEAALTRPARTLQVLITSGPTAEPVDGVRMLTNASTGRTGAGIAEHFARRGHRVVFLRGHGSAQSAGPVEETPFGTVADLETILTRQLADNDFDAIIHAAAVGDFAVDSVEVEGTAQGLVRKLGSDRAPVVRLRRTPKLVESLRAWSRNPQMRLVAFKLTNGAAPEEITAAVDSLLARSSADWVVHNDLVDRASGENFPATVYRADGSIAQRCPTRRELAQALEHLLTSPRLAESMLSI